MSNKKDIKRPLFGVFGVAIIIVVLSIFVFPSSNDSETVDDEENEQSELAISLVQNFKGTDGKGSTIQTYIDTYIENIYEDFFDIFDSPSTKIVWLAFHKPNVTENIFEVHYLIKTHWDDAECIFVVNLDSGEVSSGNFAGELILWRANTYSVIG